MRLLTSTLLTLWLTAFPVMAGFMQGAQLNTECDRKDPTYLLGYVMGATDAAEMEDQTNHHHFVCMPADVTAAQLAAVFCKYVKANPEQWNWSATTLLYNAQVKAFPCA